MVGGIVAVVLNLPLVVGLLFGSLVAATDPVAVIGVFKGLRAPPRLAAIAESESLINDGVAITIYTAVLGLALTGTGSATEVAADLRSGGSWRRADRRRCWASHFHALPASSTIT